MHRLRLVEDPPDAPLDPLKEVIEAREAVQRLYGNPLMSDVETAVECMVSILDGRIPNPRPKGREG